MMPCENIKLADGTVAIACSGRRRARKCSVCGDTAMLLCDFTLPPPETRTWRWQATCSKPLCARCAVKDGKLDLCPDHPREQGALAL